MKKILVTGSSGYIGTVLVPYLENCGFECIGYDTGFFKDCFLYNEPQSKKIIWKDVRDITDDDLSGIDVVVHLSGISNDPLKKMDNSKVYDPVRLYSLMLAKKCKEKGVRFIFASSCSVYGIGSDEYLAETSPTNPQTGYSINKLQIEEDLKSISDKNFSPIALRFATAFGSSPRIRFDIVINMLTGMAFTENRIILNSDGTAWRPNIHVLDFCEAIKRSIDLDYSDGELLILNVGDDKNNLQVIEIAKIIQEYNTGCEIKFLKENPELDDSGLVADRKVKGGGADTRNYKVSFEKIKKVFPGFECKWSVTSGVREMIEVFNKISLTSNMFKNRNFYRLQQMEYLYENKFLSDEFRWIKSNEV